MKKNAIAIIAFAAVSSLSGFTDVSKTADQQARFAISASPSTSHSDKFQDLTPSSFTGRTNKFLSSWD